MARKRRSKPARTSKQNGRQPRPAPITLEDFSALFTSWDGQTGDVVATPREASIRACYAVCVTHAGTPGTVMVSASDVGAARQTLDLLKGYFTDRPELSPMLKRVTPDTIHLYGGQQILVTTAPRSPAGLLSAIKLEPSRRSTRPISTSVTLRARCCLPCAMTRHVRHRSRMPSASSLSERAEAAQAAAAERQQAEFAERRARARSSGASSTVVGVR